MQKIDGTKITVVLMNDQLEKLDEISKKFGLKRSDTLRKILETGLDAYRIYESFGVMTFAEIIKKSKEGIMRLKQPRLI